MWFKKKKEYRYGNIVVRKTGRFIRDTDGTSIYEVKNHAIFWAREYELDEIFYEL